MASPRMTDDEIWAFVGDGPTGILTTLRRDGVPIALPLWYACLDRRIYVRTRGRKLQRIARDPRASFLVESGTRWAELKAVHLTGIAEIIDLEPALARQFQEEMERKYGSLQATGTEMAPETAEYYAKVLNDVVRFTPEGRILNWDNAKIAGTR
jgi:nitroimidazol reductase NimA-like FMN-containing flavoprotein (pyridoxamine 5'-phosphate oxidase superfamily)